MDDPKVKSIQTTVALDREPFGKFEEQVVSGFPQIEGLEEIWARERNEQLTGSYAILLFYLAFRDVNDARSRELCDQIVTAFNTRHYWEKTEFRFIPIPWGTIPSDLPARIWRRRQAIVKPTEREIALAKKRQL